LHISHKISAYLSLLDKSRIRQLPLTFTWIMRHAANGHSDSAFNSCTVYSMGHSKVILLNLSLTCHLIFWNLPMPFSSLKGTSKITPWPERSQMIWTPTNQLHLPVSWFSDQMSLSLGGICQQQPYINHHPS
jgi:hypothetical protein